MINGVFLQHSFSSPWERESKGGNIQFVQPICDKAAGTDTPTDQVDYMEDIAVVEEIARVDFLLYETDILDRLRTGEPARRSIVNHSIIIRLLRWSCRNC